MTHDVPRAQEILRRHHRLDLRADADGLGYVLDHQGGRQDGRRHLRDEGSRFAGVPENWMPYLAVDNVDARVKKAVAAGASVMREPFDIPGVGRIAILHEPGGAAVGWMTPESS